MSTKKNAIPINLKPMEVYHKITPVRSIQQSINLIKALRNEEQENLMKTRPKSCAIFSQSNHETYGSIPNLRVPDLKIQNTLNYYKTPMKIKKFKVLTRNGSDIPNESHA